MKSKGRSLSFSTGFGLATRLNQSERVGSKESTRWWRPAKFPRGASSLKSSSRADQGNGPVTLSVWREMESGEASVYGASLAGGSFDFMKFIKQPQTVLRVLSWVFAIVVFATITAEGYVNSPYEPQAVCVFNKNDGACHYGVGIGVIGFLACVAFLMADVYLPMMSNAQERKRMVLVDLVFSGAWTFLWFICFCLLANQWASTTETSGIIIDAVHAIIAFSFFSIATWGGLTYLALMRFRQGMGEITQNYAESPPDHTSPYPTSYVPPEHASSFPTSTYPSFPPGRSDIYQQPSFMPKQEPMGDSDYQPPAY